MSRWIICFILVCFSPLVGVELDPAIPAGAPHNGVLSDPCPLIGESNVKDGVGLGGSGAEFSENSTSMPVLTTSDLASCDPGGIAELDQPKDLARKIYLPKENVVIFNNQIFVGKGNNWVAITELSSDTQGLSVTERSASFLQWECENCGFDNWFWEDYCWNCGRERD